LTDLRFPTPGAQGVTGTMLMRHAQWVGGQWDCGHGRSLVSFFAMKKMAGRSNSWKLKPRGWITADLSKIEVSRVPGLEPKGPKVEADRSPILWSVARAKPSSSTKNWSSTPTPWLKDSSILIIPSPLFCFPILFPPKTIIPHSLFCYPRDLCGPLFWDEPVSDPDCETETFRPPRLQQDRDQEKPPTK